MSIESAAHSVDGYWFRFTAAIEMAVAPGSYVHLDAGDERAYLGQILDVEAGDTGPTINSVTGLGAIRAAIDGGKITSGPASPFGLATVCRYVRAFRTLLSF